MSEQAAASFGMASEVAVLRSKVEALEDLLQVQAEVAEEQSARLLRELEAERDSRNRTIQAEKMASIGQLAAGMAHEINNPLGVILGFSQGLERRVPEGNPLRLPVTSIVREALRCKTLVQELLTFSRTAKKSAEEVDLNGLVRSSAVLLNARSRTQGVQVVLDLAEPGPRTRANMTQLQQVLVNLGTNALDVMKEGGTLTLRTRLDPAGKAVLQVADTGSGIPEELRSRIFEPFFTTKGVGEGTGLGLSLVFEIVHQHDGRIDVECPPEGGTAMTVSLPAIERAEGERSR